MRALVVTGIIISWFFFSGAVPAQEISHYQGKPRTGFGGVPDAATATQPPWSAIGRVNRRSGGFCSGTLIRADKVLTSAHCLWNKARKRWIPSDDLHFLAGYHMGKYVVHRRIAMVELADNVEITWRGHPRNPRNDWAILTLDRSVASSAMLRPVETYRFRRRLAPSELGPLVRAGYSAYRPYALSTDTCRAVGMMGRSMLMHNCDATIEESGYPILVKTRYGWRILGLQMATFKQTKHANGLSLAVLVTAIPDRLTR